MGSESSVPIEPDTQTSLLDACLQVKGVLIAGVPGAGGYDAIFCIIADDGDGEDSTFHRLLDVWESWEVRVCPLLAREENLGIMLENADALLS
jgi:phosphomevalonate kinase